MPAGTGSPVVALRSVVLVEEHPAAAAGGIALRNAANIAGLAALGPVTVVGAGDKAGLLPRSALGECDAIGLGVRAPPDREDRWARREAGHPSDDRWTPPAEAVLQALLRRCRPDVVVVEQLWLHRYITTARGAGAFVVLDAHNVETSVYEQVAATACDARRDLDRLMARRTATIERRAAGAVDQVWACSADDQRWFADRGADAWLVPNVVDTTCPPRRGPAPEPLIVFMGSFAYPPNQRAASMLVDEVLPAVAQHVDGATLALVGHSPPAWLREQAARRSDIEVTGTVASVRPWLERAFAVVVPLREGGGTRFKVLEAMAAGVPVVSTQKGIEGLGLVSGREVLVGDGPAELARLTVEVWHDPARSAELVERARAVVETQHSLASAADHIRARRSSLASLDVPQLGTSRGMATFVLEWIYARRSLQQPGFHISSTSRGRHD